MIESPTAAAKPISADSHTCEPPWCYKDNIEAKYKERAPHIEYDPVKGDCYVIEGFASKVSLPSLIAAGVDQRKRPAATTRFEDLHKGGWDAKARLADQDRDGVAAEVVYPTIGMVLCGLSDLDYKNACMWAYNRWLEEFVAAAPDRVFGIGQTAVRSVPEAIEDLRRMKEMGFVGAMMPGDPGTEEDYDHPSFDPLWQASVELKMPLSFHILTSGRDAANSLQGLNVLRGPKINAGMNVIRGVQDIIGMFIWGQVFERNPDLKIVGVEGDAGWAPHYIYRSNHLYKEHAYLTGLDKMERAPGDYFRENIYLTFQDDLIAFQSLNHLNSKRLMWANDYPHVDSCWLRSQSILDEHTKFITPEQKASILHENVSQLYSLSVN